MTGLRLGFSFVLVSGAVILTTPRQLVFADAPPESSLISRTTAPKPGDKVKILRAEVKTKTTDDGDLEVMEVAEPAGAGEEVVVPSTHWTLDVDGWFDADGLNLTAVYPRSGLWSMRRSRGQLLHVPMKSSDKASDKVIPEFASRPLPIYADKGDMISHVDSIAVTSYPALVYAVNNAKNKRDIPIVWVNGRTGMKRIMYVTAHKDPK